jgi:hypothetical protein
MQFMQAESSQLNLKKLAAALTRPGMPSQAVIGAAAGVSQSTVSRAICGLIGESRGARLLWQYIQSRPPLHTSRSTQKGPPPQSAKRQRKQKVGDQILKQAALERLQAYLDDEFDPELVIEQIGVLRRAQRVNARGRKPQGTSVMAG